MANLLALLGGATPGAVNAMTSPLTPQDEMYLPAIPQTDQPVNLPIGTDFPANAELEHKGIFGIKGQARDILGGIFDALTNTYGKGGSPYATARAREKYDDAAAFSGGFMENPVGMIQKLNDLGMTKEAEGLWQQYQANKLEAAKTAGAVDQSRAAAGKNRAETKAIFDQQVSNILKAVIGKPDDYPQYYEYLKKLAERDGMDISYIPATYDEATLRGIAAAGLEEKDLLASQYHQDVVDERRENNRREAGIKAAELGVKAALGGSKAVTDAAGVMVDATKPTSTKGSTKTPRPTATPPRGKIEKGRDGNYYLKLPNGGYTRYQP